MKRIIIAIFVIAIFGSCSKKANHKCYTNTYDSLGNAVPMAFVCNKYFSTEIEKISFQQKYDFTCIKNN